MICAVLAALSGLAAAPIFGPFATVPPAIAVASLCVVLGEWPRTRAHVAIACGTAAVASLAATVLYPRPPGTGAGALGTVEVMALLPLIVMAARAAPAKQAVVVSVAAHSAATLWVLRFLELDSLGSTLAGCIFWSLAATAAAGGGIYLRSLDADRIRAVAAARQSQRLELARDLHDFIAHDVSEMVAQAQAGRFIGEQDPKEALATLERIEKAGLSALTSMDRTIHMLHSMDEALDATNRPQHGLADLPELAERFAASSQARVHLDLDPELHEGVAREVAATGYRVVVEALTNVRRHAPTATQVDIHVQRTPGSMLKVTVINDAEIVLRRNTDPRGDRRSGLGLPGLSERVEFLGGTLTAGPDGNGGWCVTATMPSSATIAGAQ